MITSIRKYLIQDTTLMTLLNNKPSIYFIKKSEEAKESEYVIYTYKIVNGGTVKDYQLTIQCIGKDLNKLLEIQDRVEFLLDNYRHNKFIGNIKRIELLNGGGQIYDNNADQYTLISYFLFKI